MNERPKISTAEWQVMDILWDESPITSGTVVERLGSLNDWQPKTIKTLLGRLVKKGFVNFREDGTRYLYRPAIRRREVVRRESRSFLERVFRGDGASLLAHFAQEVELSEEQVAKLQRLLDGHDQSDSHDKNDDDQLGES